MKKEIYIIIIYGIYIKDIYINKAGAKTIKAENNITYNKLKIEKIEWLIKILLANEYISLMLYVYNVYTVNKLIDYRIR